MAKYPFVKYHGTGNDFVLIDDRAAQFPDSDSGLISAICHRRFGIGADGLILIRNIANFDFEMVYFNSDGNPSSMCGNGGRCVTAFAHELGIISGTARFMAVDGAHEASLTPNGIKLKMGLPTGYRTIGDHHWIHTGSPHYLIFMKEDVRLLDVKTEGAKIRYSEEWKREGTNVNFINLLPDGRLFMRTYERGVEDETLSCGTGMTAAGYVLPKIAADIVSPVVIETPGGTTFIHLHPNDAPELEGPATFVFKGEFSISDFKK